MGLHTRCAQYDEADSYRALEATGKGQLVSYVALPGDTKVFDWTNYKKNTFIASGQFAN